MKALAAVAKKIWKGFVGFCVRHSFHPAMVLVVLGLCVVLLGMSIVSVKVVTSRTVRLGLKDMGELATQAGYFTNVQVLEDSKQLFGHNVPLTKSKYIFSYDGIIKAGFDFQELEMQVNEITRTIHVTLPEAKILNCEIDENSLQIYDATQSIFTPLSITDINESMIELKETVKTDAVNNGILENARENAKLLIRGFLAGCFDLQEYIVEFR